MREDTTRPAAAAAAGAVVVEGAVAEELQRLQAALAAQTAAFESHRLELQAVKREAELERTEARAQHREEMRLHSEEMRRIVVAAVQGQMPPVQIPRVAGWNRSTSAQMGLPAAGPESRTATLIGDRLAQREQRTPGGETVPARRRLDGAAAAAEAAEEAAQEGGGGGGNRGAGGEGGGGARQSGTQCPPGALWTPPPSPARPAEQRARGDVAAANPQPQSPPDDGGRLPRSVAFSSDADSPSRRRSRRADHPP